MFLLQQRHLTECLAVQKNCTYGKFQRLWFSTVLGYNDPWSSGSCDCPVYYLKADLHVVRGVCAEI